MDIKTRNDARADGDTYFYTGRACKRGHLERRYVSSGTCLGCERLRDKARYDANPDYHQARSKAWNKKNPERKKAMDAAYEKKNRTEINTKRREKYATCDIYRSSVLIRCLVRNTLYATRTQKRKDIKTSLGYSPTELAAHLESLFTEGMSWDNYGDWEIDHIKPLAAFMQEGNFDPVEINALDNLQPLWAIDNSIKGYNYDR